MATDLYDLTQRVMAQFSGVPNVTALEAEAWSQTAVERHGYEYAEDVPTKEIYLVMMLAEAYGARAIALRTAHYFEYQDGDERVNQSEVSNKYQQIATSLLNDYKNESVRTGRNTSKFRVAKRLDRY